mmetsp:Transcript_1107/g.3407  ORF Transcript_1107/g.3407 Transcript_1107/m.3407 type:complete len:238 (-) Transcript_1107:947-1660(-)
MRRRSSCTRVSRTVAWRRGLPRCRSLARLTTSTSKHFATSSRSLTVRVTTILAGRSLLRFAPCPAPCSPSMRHRDPRPARPRALAGSTRLAFPSCVSSPSATWSKVRTPLRPLRALSRASRTSGPFALRLPFTIASQSSIACCPALPAAPWTRTCLTSCRSRQKSSPPSLPADLFSPLLHVATAPASPTSSTPSSATFLRPRCPLTTALRARRPSRSSTRPAPHHGSNSSACCGLSQ